MTQEVSPKLAPILSQLDSLGISAQPYGESGQLIISFFDSGYPFKRSDVVGMIPCLNSDRVYDVYELLRRGEEIISARKVYFLISASELSFSESIKGMEKFLKEVEATLKGRSISKERD